MVLLFFLPTGDDLGNLIHKNAFAFIRAGAVALIFQTKIHLAIATPGMGKIDRLVGQIGKFKQRQS